MQAAEVFKRGSVVRGDVVSGRPVDMRQMFEIERVYETDPTIRACRGIIASVIKAADIEFPQGGRKMTKEFRAFVQMRWKPFVEAAHQQIEQFG